MVKIFSENRLTNSDGYEIVDLMKDKTRDARDKVEWKTHIANGNQSRAKVGSGSSAVSSRGLLQFAAPPYTLSKFW